MYDVQRFLEMLQSPDSSKRYDACEELRVAPWIPAGAIAALRTATADSNPEVADAARRALDLHVPAPRAPKPIEAPPPTPQPIEMKGLSCEQCGRDAGAISGCPERPLGTCPFVQQWRRRRFVTLGVGGLIAVVFAVLTGAVLLTSCGLPTVFIAIPFGFWAISLEVQLHNAKTGTRLQRTTLAGIELSCRWTSRGSLFAIHLEPGQPLAYPLSITALAALSTRLGAVSKSQAVAIVRAALIDLLLKECIEVYPFQSCLFRRWQRSPSVVTGYMIVAAQNTDQAQGAGVLESAIIRAVAAWPSKSRAKEWTDGPPIYDLVRAVYESDKSSPTSWLVERVAQDAAARSLCQLQGMLFWKKIEWDAAHASHLQREQQITQALSERLRQAYPEFSRALDEQISKAIASRQDSGD